jgi:DNA-binding NarL/FixJ family response regulator
MSAEICELRGPNSITPKDAGTRTLHAVIASNDVILRHGLRCIVEGFARTLKIVETTSIPAAAAATTKLRPQVLVLDVGRSAAESISVLPTLARQTSVILITRRRDDVFTDLALKLGAAEVLIHDELTERDFGSALRSISAPLTNPNFSAGRSRPDALVTPGRYVGPTTTKPAEARNPRAVQLLSPRERDVMAFVARGLRNADIADVLSMSEKTVKNHINRIFAKLQVDTRARAILLWLNSGQRASI